MESSPPGAGPPGVGPSGLAEGSAPVRDIRAYRPSFVGMVLLACTLFLVLGAEPAYGVGATVALILGWLALFGLGCRWFVRHPRRVALAGLASLLAWLVAVLLAR
jgi:hypothetical protein